MIFNRDLTPRQVLIIESLVIFFFTFFPLFMNLPYRSTIYLTWEGAYRMYLGQMPFKDFGLPMGYGFWVIPFIIFKILGPFMYNLVIAQALINLVAYYILKGILKLFNLKPMEIFLTIMVFSLSYVLINFWPWYNHSVVFYELIGLYLLLRYLLKSQKIFTLICAAFFVAFSFFTKQDTGGTALLISLGLLITDVFLHRKFKPLLIFIGAYTLSLMLFILPLLRYDFSYWFNYGQPPHFSRINLYDFLTAFFHDSSWLKFYILATIVMTIHHFTKLKSIKADKPYLFFSIFTLGMLAQAMITQVTTYTPPTSTIYFHTFGVAFIVYNLGMIVQFEKLGMALVTVALIFFWHSENYWKYTNKLMSKVITKAFAKPPSSVVSINTWSSKADSVYRSYQPDWHMNKYRSLKHIKLPLETIKGLERMEALPVLKNRTSLSCLNMTNLTSMAYDLNYPLETGPRYPLWFHKGVILFDKETKMLCQKISDKKYDLILFEVEPNIDGFFSFDVQACIKENYRLVDSFPAPTGLATHYIEVYVK